MSLNVRHKHSSVQDQAPQPSDLVNGEIALNINANSTALYTKNSAGAVVKLAPTDAPVDSVFGRTGAVVAADGDYDLGELGDVDLSTTAPTNGQFLSYDGANWVPGDVVSSVDLGYTASATDGTVTNSAGLDAIIPLVTAADAGLISPGDKTKLDGIQAGAEVNAVDSVFGRTGAVVATDGDYDLGELGDVDLTTTPPSSGQVLSYDGTNWVPHTTASAPVDSVFGRTGAVVATEGDYELDQLGDVDLTSSAPTSGQFLKYDGANWVPGSVVSSVDLAYTPAASSGTVTNTAGTDATIPAFTSTNAGLVGGSGGGTANYLRADGTWSAPPGDATDLGYTASATDGTVTSSNGTDATVPLVTGTNAGLMAPGDKTKLDGIQAGAEVNAVDSVFGRTGTVVATEGDYSLDQLGDVDLTTTPPTTGQILTYDGAGWVADDVSVPDPLTVNNLTVNTLLTAEHIHGNLAGSVYIHVKNTDTVQLDAGTPFYITGTVGASDRVEIQKADSSDPTKGPAVGVLETTLAINGEGNGVILGEIFNFDTATPGWSTNDSLYVANGGGLTNVKPTSGYRQIIAYVGRIQASTGTLVLTGTNIDPVAGSNTQIQFNDNGGFGGSTDLTFDGFRVLASAIGYFNRRPVLHRGSLFYKTAATTVSIIAGSVLNGVAYNTATAVAMPGSFTNNTDYAIWQNPTTGALVADASFTTAPAGATGGSIVGGFHYIPSGRPTAFNEGSPTTAAEVLEYSLWDLTYRPSCPDPRGMACIEGGYWIDLYLTGATSYAGSTFSAVPSSKIGLTIADGSSAPLVPAQFGGNGSTTYGSFTWYEASEMARSFGKKLPTYDQFSAAAYGAPEAGSRGTDPGTVQWERVSLFGLAQATGTLWQWAQETCTSDPPTGWQAGVTEGRGDVYGSPTRALILGGSWNVGSNAGSRCAAWLDTPWYSDINRGSRFVAGHLILA